MSHSSFYNFDCNANYFIGLNLKFVLPSDFYRSNSMSFVLNILRHVVRNQSL